MAARSILILDDDEDLRDVLSTTVQEVFRWDCMSVGSVRALIDLGSRALAASLAIIDINLGLEQPSGLDAFAWLREKRFGGRIVFLTGHAASHPLVDMAQREQLASIYQKPLTIVELGQLLEAEVPS
jgi:DNA-binding NtrC family response regulator